MTTPLLDDDELIQLTTDETVYMGCTPEIPIPPDPDIPPAEDFVPFLVTIIDPSSIIIT